MVRNDHQFGVLANERRNRSASEIAARDEFNRQHPPIESEYPSPAPVGR